MLICFQDQLDICCNFHFRIKRMYNSSIRFECWFTLLLTYSVFGSVVLLRKVITIAQNNLPTPDINNGSNGEVTVTVVIYMNSTSLKIITLLYETYYLACIHPSACPCFESHIIYCCIRCSIVVFFILLPLDCLECIGLRDLSDQTRLGRFCRWQHLVVSDLLRSSAAFLDAEMLVPHHDPNLVE